jgi:hypothetical protein
VVATCRYQKFLKTPKAVATIQKRPFQRPISISASLPAEARASAKKLVKKFEEKGVSISVEKQREHMRKGQKR